MRPPALSSPLTGLLCAIAAAVLFSSKAVFVKMAYQYPVQPATLLMLRMAIALPFYVGIALWGSRDAGRAPLTPRSLAAIGALGVCSYYGSALLDLAGLQYIPANLERLLVYLYPTFVLFLGAALLGRKLGRRELGCVALAYAGIAVVFGQDLRLHGDATAVVLGQTVPAVLWGSLLVIGSAFLFACYMLGSERYILRFGGARFTSLAMMAAAVAVALHFALAHPLADLVQPWQVYALAFVIAVLTTVVPSLLAAEGVKRIGAARTGIAGTAGPIATLVLGYYLLGEPMTPLHAAGMLLVLISLYLLARRS